MLRITKEADYGIMLLTYMAGRPLGVVHSAKEASHWSGLPLPMVSKILRGLAKERLLVSHRGAAGGYSLERLPTETSVADVVRALEGPISLVQCGSDPGGCDQESSCPTRVNWNRISRAVEQALTSVTIADMVLPNGVPLEPSLPPADTLLTVAAASHKETEIR